MAAFACVLVFIIMPVAVIRLVSSLAGKKGQSRQFFAQLDSVQECSGPQFELCSGAGQIQERFVKRRPQDRYRHCQFSPIRLLAKNIMDLSLDF
jgi:hypothetical protein